MEGDQTSKLDMRIDKGFIASEYQLSERQLGHPKRHRSLVQSNGPGDMEGNPAEKSMVLH